MITLGSDRCGSRGQLIAKPTGAGLKWSSQATKLWVAALIVLVALVIAALLSAHDGPGGTAHGQGWITSPPGAYVSDPSLTGRALFSFEASREKGEGVPRGRVTFALGAADFAFESVVCDGIALSSATAWLEGRGTVNEPWGLRLHADRQRQQIEGWGRRTSLHNLGPSVPHDRLRQPAHDPLRPPACSARFCPRRLDRDPSAPCGQR